MAALPIPNMRDFSCALAASMSGTVGGILTGGAVAALAAWLLPVTVVAVGTVGAAGAGGGGLIALSSGIGAAYPDCQRQNNEAYERKVLLNQRIGYCKEMEAGTLEVANVFGRKITLSQAAYFNQVSEQYKADYADCVKNGHIVEYKPEVPKVPEVPALPESSPAAPPPLPTSPAAPPLSP